MNTEKCQICDFLTTKNQKTDFQVESEISLPDYYAAINRVIKCKASAMINTKSISNKVLTIGGYVNFNVIYSDAENKMSNAVTGIPFNKTIDLEGDYQEDDLKLTPFVNFANCKPIGERRAQLSASVSLNAAICEKNKTDIITEINEETFFTKKDTLYLTSLSEKLTKNIYIETTILPTNCAETVRGLMRSDISVRLNECKVLGEKIVAKGEVLTELCLFSKQTDEIKKEISLQNFSQIIDLTGSYDDDVLCNAAADIQSYEIIAQKDANDAITGFELQVKVAIEVAIYESKSITYIVDAFSKSGSYGLKKTTNYLSFAEKINENYSCKKTFDVGSYIQRLLDSQTTCRAYSAKVLNGELVIDGVFTFSAIACDDASEQFCIEKNIEFQYTYKLTKSVSEAIALAKLFIIVCDSQLVSGNEIELKIEIKVCATVFELKQMEYVDSIEEVLKPENNNCNVRILYDCSGKNVWQIAKECLADPQSIKEINCIENEEKIDSAILLIPD